MPTITSTGCDVEVSYERLLSTVPLARPKARGAVAPLTATALAVKSGQRCVTKPGRLSKLTGVPNPHIAKRTLVGNTGVLLLPSWPTRGGTVELCFCFT